MGQALSLLLAALLAAHAGHVAGPASRAGPSHRTRHHAASASAPKASHRTRHHAAPASAPKASRRARHGAASASAPKASHRTRHRAAPASAPKASRLDQARAALRALMRDPQRRRFHHHWDKAIAGLLAAARGSDAPAATLEAARARYALYRWSADEADRDKALALAGRASRLGAREAAGFAAAVRREAGDERPARAAAPGQARPPVPAEEAPAEPQLEAALADLKDPAPAIKLGESGGEGTATVAGVKTWTSDDYTRVAIRLDHWVGWQPIELPAQGDAPRRLALDFRPARLDGAAMARDIPGRQVDRVRAAQHDDRTVRVVLDLPGRHGLQFYGLDDPPRLIVDVGTRRAPAAEPPVVAGGPIQAPPQPEGAAAGPAAAEGSEARPIRRIVVDAGHGGADPGAIGPTRVREKDVTLAMARRLAARLRAGGFEVVMTRSDDRYVALEERTAIANTQRGDLLISIHANANPRRALAGTETWILNVADDRYAKRLAARENGAAPEDGGDADEARRILTDLDAKSSTEASRRLAQSVQRELTGSVRGRYGDDRDLGVKSALFYVLVGARMPAVLVETAFISNRREEQRLASPAYQDLVAASLTRAVEQFARRDARVARADEAAGPARP